MTHIINEGFVSEGISVPIAEIRAIEVKKTGVWRVFLLFEWISVLIVIFGSISALQGQGGGDIWLGVFIWLVIGGLCAWIKEARGMRLIIRTSQQTFQVKASEKKAFRMYAEVDEAMKARSGS